MADRNNNWDNNLRGASQDNPENGLLSADQLRQQTEKHLEESKNALSNTLSVKAENGKYYFLGFNVTKEMAFLLNQGLINARPLLNSKGTEFFYDKTAEILQRLKHSPTEVHSGGLAAAGIFSAILIGAEPVMNLWRVHSDHNRQKTELLQDLAPVIAASKGNYKSNEIIKTELNRINSQVVTGLKLFTASLPYLVPTVMSATHDYAVLKDTKGTESAINGKLKQSVEEMMKDYAERFSAGASEDMELAKTVAEVKKNFLRDYKHKRNPATKQRYSERELNSAWSGIEQRIRSEVRQEKKAAIENQHKIKEKNADKGHEASMQPWITGTGLISEFLKNNITQNEEDHGKHTNAYQMVKQLKKEIEEQCSGKTGREYSNGEGCLRKADEIEISPDNKEGKRIPLKDYIIEVFRQNERDNGRGGLEGNLVTQLRPAIDAIADHIAAGTLDAYALINLVGENKVLTHTGTQRGFASEKEVAEAISALEPVMGAHTAVTPEDFFAGFADPMFVKETLKKNLETMQGEQKALFASLFADDILQQAGVKKEEIVELRKKAHEHMSDFVAAAAMDIKDKSPEALKALGLSEEQIKGVTDFIESVKSDNKDAVETALYGRDKTILTAVSIAGLNEQVATKKDPWVKRVSEMSGIRGKIEKMMAESAEADMPEGDIPEARDTADRDDGVLSSAKKKIGNDLDEVSMMPSHEARIKSKRAERDDSRQLPV